MHDPAILPLLIIVVLILSGPAALAVLILFRRVQRQHDETLAALAALMRTVQELRGESAAPPREAHLAPPMTETAETPPVARPERPEEGWAESREAEPPAAADEFVEAMIVLPSGEGPAPEDSTTTEVAAGRSAASPADAGTVDTLKRIGNWFLFGQEQAPSGASIEIAIAANWLLRIGMLILVLGIAFFLKYSIDRGWIGPFERVMLGTAAGLAMVTAGSMLLGGRYRLLAHGLQGGGIVTLYLSVFAAAVFLELIDPIPVGFVLMACVTALACFLALTFGSPLTAVIGIAGGYLTPVVLPSEDVQFVALYTYLAILGMGVLAISVRRSWPQLNVLSFLGTYGLLFVSIVTAYSPDVYWIILFFLVLLFLLFSTIVFLSSRFRSRADLFDLAMLWLNALFFFGLGGSVTALWLDGRHCTWRWTAVIPLGIAGFYSAHVYLLMLRRQRDTVLFHASLGLAAAFTAMAVPMVLSKQWIVFAWAVQSLIMLWLSLRIDSRLLRSAAWILFTVTGVSFAFPLIFGGGTAKEIDLAWRGHLAGDMSRLIPRLAALGGSFLCVALAARLAFRGAARARGEKLPADEDRKLRTAGRVLAVLATAMLFLYGTHEISAGVSAYLEGLQSGAVSIWWSMFAVALIAAGMWKSQRWVRAAGLLLFAVVTCKVFFSDLSELSAFYRIIAFVILGVVIISGSVLYLRFRGEAGKDTADRGGPMS
ncbi:MAG: DUF2339 domain-containing protein [Thermogutta sp.]|nr:DUF2339 domain-containing protein [Thermogutta sp.]